MHVVTGDYIVFTDASQRVVSLSAYFVEGQNDFLGRLQRVQAMPVPTLTEAERAHLRAMLGYALAASLEEEFDAAEAGLETAHEYARTQAEKHASLEYLRGAAAVALVFLLVSVGGLLVASAGGFLEKRATAVLELVAGARSKAQPIQGG